MKSKSAPVLLLGHPQLRVICAPVTDLNSPEFRGQLEALKATLHEFRTRNGFGRAMAAPQVGIMQRVIVLHWEGVTQFLVNPAICMSSDKMRTLWDDCMSLPGLMVRVARHESISIKFQDEKGDHHDWHDLSFELSELLQHEMDHLDGILAVDRAIDKNALVAREQFLSNPDYYFAQVDYVIPSYRKAV